MYSLNIDDGIICKQVTITATTLRTLRKVET